MYAIISDIHSNLEALDVVLADIASIGAKEILCLGDIIGYGPNPRECVEKAFNWEFSLCGNHEEAVLFYADDFNVNARKAINWTKDQLNSLEHDRGDNYKLWDFLGNLKSEVRRDDVLFVHGSPRLPTREYVLPRDATDHAKLGEIFSMIEHICFVGHTHYPGIFTEEFKFVTLKELGGEFTVEPGKKVLVNIGSVGQPRDGDNRASYVIVDGDTVRWRRLDYDYEKTMKKIIGTGELPPYLAQRLKDGV